MIKTLNIHFTYEHIFGHHRKVATPEDPASAAKGDNIYLFTVKSYLGAYKSVYSMEVENKKPFYLNMAIVSVFASITFVSLILYFYGPITAAIFVL